MEISKRLNNFIDDHLDYEDLGCPESGPKLTPYYNGPEWAITLMSKTIDPEGYAMNCYYEWEFDPMWYDMEVQDGYMVQCN